MTTHPAASELIHAWYEECGRDDHMPFHVPHHALRQLVHRVQDALDAAHARADDLAAGEPVAMVAHEEEQ